MLLLICCKSMHEIVSTHEFHKIVRSFVISFFNCKFVFITQESCVQLDLFIEKKPSMLLVVLFLLKMCNLGV